MKLLLLIVSVIAVFDANCRNFPDLPDSVNGAQNLPDEDHDSANEDRYVNNEPEIYDSAYEDMYAPAELESHGSSKNVQQLKKRSLHGTHKSKNPQDMDSVKENQDLEKEEKGKIGRKIRKSRCKAKNICVVMSGFCVTNATLCSGRLVSKGCKGPDCQCCVPGSFNNQLHNLTNEIKSLQTNFSATILEMNMKLELMEDNFTDSISNISSKLDHNIESTGTFENKIQDLENKINAMQTNLNGTKLNINMTLKHMEDTFMDSFSNISSKLDYYMEHAGCPGGFQIATQCFKIYKDRTRSWSDAITFCQSKGYILAEPKDSIAVALRRYLYNDYGHGNDIWVGARGDGSGYMWQHKRQYLSSSSPLWEPGQGSSKSSSQCVEMNLHSGSLSSHPTQPYDDDSCTSNQHALCEVLIK